MSDRCRQPGQGSGPPIKGLIALALAICLAMPALAADPEPSEEKGQKTILLWVRIGPNVSRKSLEDNFTIIKNREDNPFSWSSIEFEPVPKEVFEFLEKQLKRGTPGRSPPPTGAEDVGLRQLSTGEWEISLPKKEKGAFTLEQLTVHFRGDKQQTIKRNAQEAANRPVVIRPGVYAVKLAHEQPVSCEAVVTDSGNPVKDPLKGVFVQGDKHYAIAIKQFQGDQKQLLDLLQKTGAGAPLANPFIGLKPTENYSLAFANWQTKSFESGATMVENKYIPNVAAIPGKPTRKVWILFPLSKGEALKERDRLREFGTLEMMKEIEKSDKKVVSTDQTVVVDGFTGPRWFELEGDSDKRTFSRGIAMKDFAGLQKKYKDGFWHVKVYEYDGAGKDTQAIPLGDEKLGTVFFQAEEIKELPAEVASRAKKVTR